MLKRLSEQKFQLSPGEHTQVTISARCEDDKFVYYTFLFEMQEDGYATQTIFESDSLEDLATELRKRYEGKGKPNLKLVASNAAVEKSVDELFSGNWWERN